MKKIDKKVYQIISDKLGIDNLIPEDTFIDMNVDSLDILEIISDVEKNFDILFTRDEHQKIKKPIDIVSLLNKKPQIYEKEQRRID